MQSGLSEPRLQSPSNSKLKRTQTIGSPNEVEEARGSTPIKRAKRRKTMDPESLKLQTEQQLSSGGDGTLIGEHHIAEEEIENGKSKETSETGDTDIPLNNEESSRPLKPSARRGWTLGNDIDNTKNRKKPVRRCASAVTKEMDDTWDRDQLDFKTGVAPKDAVDVQITTNLTRSQEQEYDTLNDEISQNSNHHTSKEKGSDEINPNADRGHDGNGVNLSLGSRENPEMYMEESQDDGNDRNVANQESTPIREKPAKMVVAISPHDTEELSSFDSAHIRRNSTSPVRELSQPTPEDPFDESPPRERMPRKQSRRGKATFIDDSDESPDELNPPVDPVKEKRKLPQSPQIQSKDEDAESQDDDDDMIIVPPGKRASHTTSHGSRPNDEGAREATEQQKSDGSEVRNSDDIDMPPKDLYKPRPSRSRGKAIEPGLEPPEVPSKGPRKKKVKRGKTTSVIVKKSLESDVEDDVVWVDEKPTGVVFRDPILPAKRKAKRSRADDAEIEPEVAADKEESTVVDQDFKPDEESREKPTSNKGEEPVEATKPPPRKRGRKPKKAAEKLQTPSEQLNPEQKDEEIANPETKGLPNVGDEVGTDPAAEQQKDAATYPSLVAQDGKDTNTPEPKEAGSPHPETAPTETPSIETPKKQTAATTKETSAPEETMTPPPASSSQKGPTKHSPISTTGSVPYRVGLSRRANIAPLLKVVRK